MSNADDIEEAIERILADGKIVEVEEVGKDERSIDAGDAHLLAEQPLPPGIRLSGKRCVVIRGDFRGTQRSPNQVEIDGDLVVTGDIEEAQVSSNRIVVGGSVRSSQIRASLSADVAGDVVKSRLTAGDFQRSLKAIRELEADVGRLKEKLELDARGLRLRQREVFRIASMARLTLHVGLGKFLQDDGSRLYVDLRPFYTIAGDRTDEDLNKAIDQFFHKVVVGALAKANRTRLIQSPSSQKTFKHLVRQLHELVRATRQSDLDERHLDEVNVAFGEKTAALCATEAVVRLGGKLHPGTEIRFARPVVKAGERLEIEPEVATLAFDVDQKGRPRVISTDMKDQKQRLPDLPRPLSLSLEGDRIRVGAYGEE